MALALALIALAPRVARAQDTQIRGTLGAGVGISDNVRFVPSRPSDAVRDPRCADGTWSPAGSGTQSSPVCNPERQAGPILDASPGVVVSYASPRALYQLSYVFTASYSPVITSYANRLEAAGVLTTSPTTELALGAYLSEGSISTLQLTSSPAGEAPVGAGPAATTANALPTVPMLVVSAGASEALAKELSPRWRLGQTLTFTADSPVLREAVSDYPYRQSFDLAGTGELERAWGRDALALALRLDFVTQTQIDAVGAAPDPTAHVTDTRSTAYRSLLGEVVARYRRDLGRWFSGDVSAGVLEVQSLGTGASLWQPAGAAALRYAREEWTAELSASHGAMPSPLLGVNLLVDAITLRGAVPLDRRGRFAVASSSGFAHTSQVFDDGSFGAPMNVLRGDVSFAWRPARSIELEVRYQHHHQLASSGAVPLAAQGPAGLLATGEIAVNTALLTGRITFPAPERPAFVFRPPRRVDRGDAAAFPHEPAPPPLSSGARPGSGAVP
jgi:hypothetical protein